MIGQEREMREGGGEGGKSQYCNGRVRCCGFVDRVEDADDRKEYLLPRSSLYTHRDCGSIAYLSRMSLQQH